MKQSLDELFSVVYRFYPRGLSPLEPGYGDTPEHRRLVQTRIQAGAEDKPWRFLIERLEARYPEAIIMNQSVHLPTGHYDAGYVGALVLPTRGAHEKHHDLRFLISFLVPCYIVYSSVNAALPASPSPAAVRRLAFTFSSDEEPYAQAITAEIHALFPGYERMPPEIGNVVVPDNKLKMEATLYHCLFTESL